MVAHVVMLSKGHCDNRKQSERAAGIRGQVERGQIIRLDFRVKRDFPGTGLASRTLWH